MRTPNYWKFTLLFWLAAGLLLFTRALAGDHWDRVIMRFMYLPVLGVALTAVMTLLFQSERFEALRRPAIWVVLVSLAAGFVTGMILNPLTYLVLGIDLIEDHFRKMTTGVGGFAATYLFWSVLYFELDGRPLLGPRQAREAGHLGELEVDDRGTPVTVRVDDIESLAASADYVQLQLADRSYLKKATISSLLGMLDPAKFRRVHRSTIVNADHVREISPRGGGTFEITLASGRVVTSSRSYRTVVQELA